MTYYRNQPVATDSLATSQPLIAINFSMIESVLGSSTLTDGLVKVQGDLIYASTSETFAKLAKAPAAKYLLSSDGTNQNPSWIHTTAIQSIGTITVGTWSADTIAVAKGGTARTAKLAMSQVTGTTDITGSDAEADMTNMTTTFTTYGTAMLVIFHAPIRAAGNNDPISLYINIDGTNKRTLAYNVDLGGEGLLFSFQHLETGLTAGSHTVKIRWNASSSTSQKGSTDSARVLTCIDLD